MSDLEHLNLQYDVAKQGDLQVDEIFGRRGGCNEALRVSIQL